MNGDRIPIVDDDEASRDTLRRLFVHEGGVVTAALCVDEAPAKLDPLPLSVLPELMRRDGEEVHRKVRDERLPTRVVVSGADDPVRLALVRGAGILTAEIISRSGSVPSQPTPRFVSEGNAG